MMADITIDASTLLKKLGKIQNIDLSKALNNGAIVVENDAKRKCPVDTGTLRRSITHELENEKTVKVFTPMEYGIYIEMGTGLFAVNGDGRKTRWSYQDDEGNWHSTIGQPPQPFMMPALNENRDKVVKVMENVLKEDLNNA